MLCSPNLVASPLTSASEYLYEIGSGPLSITMDGISNGNCFFAISVFDTADMLDVSSAPPFTLTQPTLLQDVPNGYSITADGVLTIDESNESS